MRRTVLAALAVGVAVVAVPALPALAGGGGHCPEEGIHDSSTAREVRMADGCFAPHVIRVAPGTEVTFVNDDARDHTVTGANHAFGSTDVLRSGDRLLETFEEEGVYPFLCMYHPGMSGSVVVGDGVGPLAIAGGAVDYVAGAPALSTALQERAAEAAAAPQAAGEEPRVASASSSRGIGAIAAAAGTLVFGGLMYRIGHRRTRPTTS